MGIEDTDKIVRITGDTGNLTIKLSPEEEKYRSKYLPDPKNLTDEKLVCTVCSVALAANVHKGKDIFVHRALHVLVCEACYNFYGDGCFSADEDGDDKYCRWCGQGGTLFLCSGCTCAFCEKCVKQNLKASVIADLEKDDWKCYICNPRPLFGCRTVCWGAGELNKIGKAKEQERLKKQKERLEKFEEKKKEQNERKSRKDSTSEGEHTTKKRKSRARYSDSSSVEIMPSKRPKRESRVGHLNNSTGRSRNKRKDSSSDDETSEEGQRKVTRRSKSNSTRKSRKPVDSDSEEDSDVKSKLKAKSKLKKKREKVSSDEFSNQQKTKYKQSKKKGSTSDEDSSDEKHSKKKKLPRKKKDVSSDSSDAKIKKKKSKNRKDSSCEDSDEANSDLSDAKEKKKKLKKRINTSSEDSDDPVHRKKKTLAKKKPIKDKNKINVDSDSESKKGNDEIEHLMVDEKSTEIKPKVNSIDSSSASENGIVKKRIQLAILWLNNIADDISELGTLISMRATNFSKKKINTEKLKTYDDVLNTVSKLKQLISGVHSNYDHIEKSLDAHLKPWKILTGLEEEPDIEHPARGETNVSNEEVPLDETVSGADAKVSQNLSTIDSGSKLNTKMEVEDEKKPEKINEWSGLSADDDSDNDGTNALISKANETLDIFEEQENLLSDGKKDNASNPTDKNNSDTIKNKMASKDSSIKKDSNDSLHSSKVNLGDGSTRESNQSSSEDEASIKNKPMKNDTTVTLTSNTKSIKEDTNNKVEKKKSDKGGNSSDSEVESLQKKSKSPIKKCLKKGGEEVLGEKLKLCETKHAKKNASKALKGKCESTGQ